MEQDPQAHRKKVIEKVKKILNLADSSSNPFENEVHVALEKARELMMKWSIAHSEVTPTGPKSSYVEITEDVAHSLTKFWVGDRMLMSAVAKLTDTRVFVRTTSYPKKRESIHYVGTPPDVAIACELYNYLTLAVRAAARRVYGKGWNMKTHEKYRNGICQAILDRAYRPPPVTSTFSQEDVNCYAMVVSNKSASIDDYYKRQGIIIKYSKQRKSKHMKLDEHFLAGYQEGRKFDLGTERRVK